jgi:hypothetical protein
MALRVCQQDQEKADQLLNGGLPAAPAAKPESKSAEPKLGEVKTDSKPEPKAKARKAS